MESSEATRMRNSGENLSFCPGTFKNAPHARSLTVLRLQPRRLLLLAALLRASFQGPGRSQTCARADGSAAAASVPAKLRAPRRSAQSPGKHIASRWGQTGSFPRREKTNTSCRSATPGARRVRPGFVEQSRIRSLLFANRSFLVFSLPRLRTALQQPKQIRSQRGKSRFGDGALRVNDDVPSCRDLRPVAAHDLAQAPPDSIAHHRAAESLLDADAEAALRQFIGAKEYCKVGTRAALSGAVDRIKFTASHQPRLARER